MLTRDYTFTRRKGLTLMELLVTVGIMVIMILTFGQILSSSQKAVSTSLKFMQDNTVATAVAQVIQMEKVSKMGFLCITQTTNNNPPMLFFTTSGMTRSKIDSSVTGDGGVSTYGLSNGNTVLFHQSWVLDATSPPADAWSTSFATIQTTPRHDATVGVFDINDEVITNSLIPATPQVMNNIVMPPVTLGDATNLWQVLAEDCTALGIMWTDGTMNPGPLPTLDDDYLNWYGVDFSINDNGTADDQSDDFLDPYTITPKAGGWSGETVATSPAVIEFDAGTNVYRALWTKEDQSNWPVAIRFRFLLKDPSLDGAYNGKIYEVTIPVGP